MQTRIYLWYIFQLIFPLISFQLCNDNAYFFDFNVVEPHNNTMVPSAFYIKSTAVALNITEVIQKHSQEFHICIEIDGLRTQCNSAIFDEHKIDVKTIVKNGEEFLFTVMMCNHQDECYCRATLNLHCCLNDAEVQALLNADKNFKIEEYISWAHSINFDGKITARNSRSVHSLRNCSTLMLLGIKSGSINYQRRQAIRETWMRDAENHHQICGVFLIGRPSHPKVQDSLAIENGAFGDLALGDIVPVQDSYHTLVDKIWHFVRWIINGNTDDCQSSKTARSVSFPYNYLVISDDDVYLNMSSLSSYLQSSPKKHFYAGEVSCAI